MLLMSFGYCLCNRVIHSSQDKIDLNKRKVGKTHTKRNNWNEYQWQLNRRWKKTKRKIEVNMSKEIISFRFVLWFILSLFVVVDVVANNNKISVIYECKIVYLAIVVINMIAISNSIRYKSRACTVYTCNIQY